MKLEWSYLPGPLVIGLVVLLALAAVALLYRMARHATKGWRLGVLVALRLALVIGVLICLLDPHLVHELRIAQPTRLLVLVDTTRSMLEQDGGDSTRLDRARSWWQNQAADDSPVEIVGFDEKLHPLKANEPWAATPSGGTSISATLRGIATLPADPPISSAILISDGRFTDGESPLSAARALSARGISLSTLTLGKVEANPMLQVEELRVPPLVTPKTSVRAVVALHGTGLQGESATLRIRSGDTVLAEKEVLLTGNSQSVDLNFQPPEKPDLQICQAELDLDKPQPAVTRDVIPFALRIKNPKIKVLYMEGTSFPEIMFLQRALQRDNSGIEVTLLQRQQSMSDNTTMQTTVNPDDGTLIYNVENPDHGYPRTLEGLLQYDVVIFSDIRVQAFTEDQLKNTEQYVEEYGGGFMMIGGDTSFGAGGFDRTVINSIIPVSMENETGTDRTVFKPVIAPEGRKHPILAVGDTPEDIQKNWAKIPNLYGFQFVNHAKPGAVVLLQHPTLTNESGPRVILAAQEIGKGRSLAFTSDTTYFWGKDFETIWGEPVNANQPLSPENSDSRYFRQFWNNTIRWLAAKRLALRNISYTVDTSLRRVHVGENFSIHVAGNQNVPAGAKPPTPPSTIHIQITDLKSNAVIQTLAASFRPATQDYETTAHLPQSGRYLIDLQHTPEESSDTAPAVVTCDTVDPELVDTRPDPALMAELAKTTGGQVLAENSTDARHVATSHSHGQPAHVEFQVQSLWDQAWILALLAGILILEWILRRRWSLI